MAVFTNALVEEMQTLKGGSHTFLKQVCADDSGPLRDALDAALGRMPFSVRERLGDRLRSLENRRFFQGFAELASCAVLADAGWEILGAVGGGDPLQLQRPDAAPCNLLVVSFLHPGRPDVDSRPVAKLRAALDRVFSRLRFAVFVRRWLPPEFDPEPVRQAVELWLREVEAGRWDSRYAAYEDEAVALEFGLVGSKDEPERVSPSGAPVLMTVGPFIAGRVMATVERRIVQDLDRYRMGPHGTEPVLVTMVSDRPWHIPSGTLRDFLYGKPSWVSSSPEHGWEAALSHEPEPCLFKDPLYSSVCGVVQVDRDDKEALAVGGRGWSNPYADAPLREGELPFSVLAEVRRDDGQPVLQRTGPKGRPLVWIGQD
ncbi:MAG TPA: hypothetical protein QGF58_30900 [Myxococcota bacterium]|nr:hypothetical protein [Myxococcota bacterium]